MDRSDYCIMKIGTSFDKEVLTYTSLCNKPVTCDWEACGPEHCKVLRIAKAHSIGRMVTEPPWDCSIHSDSDSDEQTMEEEKRMITARAVAAGFLPFLHAGIARKEPNDALLAAIIKGDTIGIKKIINALPSQLNKYL
jgi:hypothetical protein